MCEDNKTSQSYYNYLEVLVKLEKYQDALEVFNSLSDEIKLDANILYLISTIAADKRQLLLERIVKIDETHEKANLELAKIEFEKGEYGKVINYCLHLEDDNPIALYYLALVESARHNYQRSIELFAKAIKFDNEEHDFYIDLAKAYIEISWFEEALIVLKKSINLSLIKNNKANLDECYLLTGWVSLKQNEEQKAVLNLNSIKENSSFYPMAQILLQTINLKNLNLAKAKSTLESYLDKHGNNPLLLDTLASVYKELKLSSKAIEILEHAKDLYPDSTYYTLEIIDLLIDEKRYDEAVRLINEFGRKYENCANIYNSLARIYYRLNNLEKALECIDIYLKLDNNTSESYYFKGLILNDMSHFEDARKSIYTAIKLNPTNAKYYNQMARSYSGLGDNQGALLYSKEAIEIDPDEIEYKKRAYDISLLIGNQNQIEIYKNQLERSEKILKLKR